MDNLNFNPETHTYTESGRVIPSVTQVLKDVGIISISPFSTGPGTGKAVHEVCEDIDCGVMSVADVPDELSQYAKAYEKFKADTGFMPELIEHRMSHPEWKYAGTIDRYGLMRGVKALPDIKTGVKAVSARVQLVAYRELLLKSKDRRVDEVFTLYLKKDGSYTIDSIPAMEIRRLWGVFLSALSVYQFKKNNNILTGE